MKCLEPPLLVQPAYFECELHMRDDERCHSTPAPTGPAAFTDSLLQSKVKVDFEIPPFIEQNMLGDETHIPNTSKLKEIMLNEVNGDEASRFLESVELPPPLSSADGEKGYLKYVFLPQFESEETSKDWSSNVILFRQFHEWLDMLRVAKTWRTLLFKIASTPEGVRKLNALRRPDNDPGEEPAEKVQLRCSSSYEDNEKYMQVLMTEDLDSQESQRVYKGYVLLTAKLRKALAEFQRSGNVDALDMFPNLKQLLSDAPDADTAATGPRIALAGKVIGTFKTGLTIGRGKSGRIGLNLGKLLGEGTTSAMSHLHATVNLDRTTKEFTISVSGSNGLYVDEVFVPQGGKAVLRNGAKITISFVNYYFYK